MFSEKQKLLGLLLRSWTHSLAVGLLSELYLSAHQSSRMCLTHWSGASLSEKPEKQTEGLCIAREWKAFIVSQKARRCVSFCGKMLRLEGADIARLYSFL